MPAPHDQATLVADAPIAPASAGRLLSLDALRGFVIGSMLLVNHTWNEAVFSRQLFHVPWNDPRQGATFTDLVFPWFLFIVGCSVPLSMRFGRGRQQPWWRLMLTAIRRGGLLYVLGVMLTVAPAAYGRPLAWADLASWNILQIIGAAYVVTVAVFLCPPWTQIAFVVAVLLGKWATTAMIPWETVRSLAEGDARLLGGAPAGPGTFAHFHGVKLYIDNALPWIGAAQQFLPAAATAVIGGWTTVLLVSNATWNRKLAIALLSGAALIAAGYLLQWRYDPAGDGAFGHFTVPFSKWVFSVPYCLLAAGTGAVLYAIFWLVIDSLSLTRATALRVWGLNAIFLYVASGMFFICIFSRWQATRPDGATDSIAGAIVAWANGATGTAWAGPYLWPALWLGGWWLVCYWMYRRKLFLRV